MMIDTEHLRVYVDNRIETIQKNLIEVKTDETIPTGMRRQHMLVGGSVLSELKKLRKYFSL